MKVALIQMVSGVDVQANLRHARVLVESAAQAGAELLVLPEYFCFMGHTDVDKLAIGEVNGQGPLQQFLADAAHDFGVWLVGGTIPLRHLQNINVTSLLPEPERVCN